MKEPAMHVSSGSPFGALCGHRAWRAFSGGDLARCVVCDLVTTARVPDFTYETAYFSDETGGGYDFDSAFSRDYDAARFGPELARLEAQALPGTLLDVGCATGSYLAAARQRGWQVTGVEVAEFGRAEARRRADAFVVASCGELSPGAAFDVVTLHHVLEHITEPLEFLRDTIAPRVRRRLLIEVPNFASLAARVHGRRWRDLRLEQHVCHYTPHTLSELVSDAGLRVTALYTLWQPLWSLRAAAELAVLAGHGVLGIDRRWDAEPADVGGTGRHDSKAAYRPPQGVRRLLSNLSRVALRPLVAALEHRGLGERLVVEAEPKGGR